MPAIELPKAPTPPVPGAKPEAAKVQAAKPEPAEALKAPAPAPEAPKPPAPAKEEPAAPAGKPGTKKVEADSFSSVQPFPVRTWTDNTGLYRCRGVLVGRLPDGTVRILRDDRRYVRVAFARLSPADQQVVVQATAGLATQ